MGTLVIAGGIAVGVIRLLGASPAEQPLEALLGAVALGAIVAAPGVLALLARHDRPALLLPAAIVLVPVSFLSFAGVLLPLLIPAVLLMIAYGRRATPDEGLRTLATVVWVLGALVAAGASLFVHLDPRTTTTATAEYGTSDVTTVIESLVSLGFVAAAITGGVALASPRSGVRPAPRM